MKSHLLPIIALCATSLFGNTGYHAMVGYPNISPGVYPQILITDAQGDFFFIGQITAASGASRIHVDKTDPNGKALGNIEFGGSNIGIGSTDSAGGAALDPQGNLVIVGSTSSPDFPQVAALPSNTQGNGGAFVTKIDAQLKNILFSTVFGGSQGTTGGSAVAIDPGGNIYVTGSTRDADFPVTAGAFQAQPPLDGARYGFVTEISANLKSVAFSTYFGDSAIHCAEAGTCKGLTPQTDPFTIALDPLGNVVIAGLTSADHLPITPAVIGPNCGDCGDMANAGFLAKFSPDGSKLIWATYVPVVALSNYEAEVWITSLAVDGIGNIIVGGFTSPGLPVTTSALQTSFPATGPFAISAGFVMKLNSAAQQLLFSTYFGGGDPGVEGLVVDSKGNIWLTGESSANELPLPTGTTVMGDSYIAALSPDGSSLITIFTAPSESAGLAVASNTNGVTAIGYARTFLTVSPAEGASLIAVENSGGFSVSNAIAPYELVSLVGLGIGPQTPASTRVVNGAVETSLENVQVLFDGIPAPLLYVGPTQINAIVPGEVYANATTTLQIVGPAGTLNGPPIPVSAAQPGVFADPVTNAAVALNQDGSVNSAMNPAALGSVVTVWASGAGISTQEQTDGTIVTTPGNPTLEVSVFPFAVVSLFRFGQLPSSPLSLEVLYAGDAAGMVAGVTQVNFRLPAQIGDIDPRNLAFSVQVGDAASLGFAIFTKPAQ